MGELSLTNYGQGFEIIIIPGKVQVQLNNIVQIIRHICEIQRNV